MALKITVKSNARNFLLIIRKKMDDKNILTWSYDNDLNFHHTPAQWKNMAWLKPTIEEDNSVLKLSLRRLSDTLLDDADRGVFYGRFTEMIISHFKNRIVSIEFTP